MDQTSPDESEQETDDDADDTDDRVHAERFFQDLQQAIEASLTIL